MEKKKEMGEQGDLFTGMRGKFDGMVFRKKVGRKEETRR